MAKRALTAFRFGPLFGWFRRNTSSRRKQIHQVRSLYKNLGFKDTGCKLCNHKNFTLLAESDRYGFDLKKQFCNECGLVQTYPSPSDQFLNDFYSHLYRPLYTKATGKVNYQSLVIEQNEKGVNLVNYLNEYLMISLKSFNLIEIGCSSGGIISEAAKHFHTVQGCDLDIEGTAYARNILELNVETSAMPSNLPDGKNIFLMSHVLEHLSDPLQTLRNVRDLLKEGDYLIVLVPGLNAVKTGDYKHDLRRYFHIAHLTDFTAGTLSSMAKLAGLDCIHIDERINAIFKFCTKSDVIPHKKNNDSIKNILEIEKKYRRFF